MAGLESWADVGDVKTFAGATVDEDAVARAQAVIDLYAGRLPADAGRVGARDRHWLRLAVAYQAAWQAAQPDLFERQDITATGGSNSTQGTPTWLVLAPHARQALARVSWLGSGSFHVRAPGENAPGRGRGEVSGDGDDPGRWRAI